MNSNLKMQFKSFLIPIIYAFFLKLFGENSIGFLMYLSFVIGGILDLITFFITLIISYISLYLYMKKNMNAFGLLDLLGKPKFLEKYYVKIDILLIYLITVSIVLSLRLFYSDNMPGNFVSGFENFGYIFIYPLFWSVFNYNIAKFLYNWMVIVKYKKNLDDE